MLNTHKTLTAIDGVYHIKSEIDEDSRGTTIKLASHLEQYFSNPIIDILYHQSNPNIVRGMHYLKNHTKGSKYIYCMTGEIHDVVIDLRAGPKQYTIVSTVLHPNEGIFVPPGCAHGFQSLTNSIVLDLLDSTLTKDMLSIHPLSIPKIQWPLENIILSQQDSAAINFEEFQKNNFFDHS